jgi:hypothetical protein
MKSVTSLLLLTLIFVVTFCVSCKKSYETETTPTVNLPVVITKQVTTIDASSAVSGGELTNATTITDKGIIWGTDSSSLTISTANKISNGAGVSNFTDTIQNLQPNTSYYVRAYAVNNAGASYGSIIRFTTLPPQPTVYITGYHGSSATYWKNGKVITLPSGTFAHSIFAAGNDIYVAGEENGPAGLRAMYWKNGNPVALTNGINPAVAKSIYVAGNDVYVAGYEQVTSNIGNASARYWKNGVAVPLTAGTSTNSGIAYSICVVGNDVYAAGFTKNDNLGNGVAVYWKNGVVVPLNDSTRSIATALSIFVVGNDVYVAGQEKQGLGVGTGGFNVAKYWKNGTSVALTDGTRHSSANDIFVTGNDVYVAGNESNASTGYSVAKYWKNGTASPLTDGTEFGDAYSITLVNGDIYIVGGEGDNLGGRFWKNGVSQPLEITAPYSATKCILVR